MISFLLFYTFFNFGSSTKRIFNPRYEKLRVRNDDSTVCNMCINLMSGISGMITDGYDQDEIQTKLLTACAIYPGDYSEICKIIGTTYLPIFIHLAKEKVPENSACVKMGYCSDLESKKI